MRVLVIRPEPAASKTAHLLKQRGHEPVLFPMSQVTCVPVDWNTDIVQWAGTIFTSANAVNCLHSDNLPDQNIFKKPTFTVGRTTELAARQKGFEKVYCGDGDGAKLSEEILKQVRSNNLKIENDSALLYLTTNDRTPTLEQNLASAGINVRPKINYRVDANYDQKHLEHLGIDGNISVILFYSAKSVQRFFKSLEQSEAQLFTSTRYGCLSSHIASHIPAEYSDKITVAKEPKEHHLLATIDR